MKQRGRFGGVRRRCTCPQILVPALTQLEEAFLAGQQDEGFQRELQRAAATMRAGPLRCIAAATSAARPRRKNLPQARGPAARWRAQDQPGDRSGAAGQAHGQDAADRRDRRRPARRGHGDGRRAARSTDRRSTWGPRTWRASGPTCFAWSSRRRGDRGRRAVRRRSRMRSTRPCATGPSASRTRTTCWARWRTASLPVDGARLPAGDRPRGARADSETEGRLPDAVIACVGGGSNAIGIFSDFLEDSGVELVGVEAGGSRAWRPASTAPLCRGAGSGCCTGPQPTCCRTKTARSRVLLDIGGTRLSGSGARARAP